MERRDKRGEWRGARRDGRERRKEGVTKTATWEKSSLAPRPLPMQLSITCSN